MNKSEYLDESESALYSMTILSALLSLNLLMISSFCHKYFSTPDIVKSRLLAFVTFCCFFSFNFFYFFWSKRYKKLEEIYKNETRKHSIIGTISIVAYWILTWALTGLMAFHQSKT